VAFLVGCDQAALMKSFTPTADESIARNCVDLLRQEKFDQIERQLDPTLVDSNLRNTLAEMAALFPNGDPESVKVVGLNVSQRQEYSATTIQLEYEFPGKWLLVSVTTQKKKVFLRSSAFTQTRSRILWRISTSSDSSGRVPVNI
jgi:hypothetical protein